MNKNINKTIQSIKNKFFNNVDNLKSGTNIIHKKFSNKIKKISSLKLEKIYQIPLNVFEKLQDKVVNSVKNENDHILLRQSQFWARAITWALMGSSAFALGWISIAETDEIVVSTGKLQPKGGVVDVQMPLEGIAREILIKDGQRVNKGEVLIRLDTEITEATNNSLQENLALNETIVERLAVLVKEGAVAEIQYLEQKAKIIELKNQIKSNLVKLKYQEIRSPVDGIVFELKPKGPGFVAQSSQPVMKIVPLDNLLAKVEIDSRTIGFVKTGKLAEISIDSFPASDFGIIKGKVTKIGSDALPPKPSEGKGYRFPAEITLDTQYLKIKSGEKLPLQAGMSLTANIKLRKVTYLQLLLNKFGDKADSLKSI